MPHAVAALAHPDARSVDLVVIDSDLAVADSRALVDALRAGGCDTPILVITASADPAERAAALDEGADDCVVSTVDPGELLAHVRALLRRGRTRLRPGTLTCGPLRLDTHEHVVHLERRRGSISRPPSTGCCAA